MRRLGVLFALFCTRVVAAEEDPALVAYALSYGPIDADLKKTIEASVQNLGAPSAARRDATVRKLIAYGEPAYRILVTVDPIDPEIRQRVLSIIERLRALRMRVLRRRLHRDIVRLWNIGARAKGRLARILPAAAPRDNILPWWARHARRYRWDPVGDRYVAWKPWRGVPLHFKGFAHVELNDSARLIDVNGEFTVEMWVRWPAAEKGTQYLAGNEAWPGMHASVQTDRTAGWVLRRHTSGDAGRLEFNMAAARGTWWSLMSDALPVGDAWEHIAVSKTRNTARIYRNGELIAERSCLLDRFTASPSDIYLGPRRYAWADRDSHQDVRAVRISNRARYPVEFTASQRFERDQHVLTLFDFADAGGDVLSDRSGKGHHGRIRGPEWMRRLTPGHLARALAAFGAEPGQLTLHEAEYGRGSADWTAGIGWSGFSDGRALALATREEPAGGRGHWAELRFDVEQAGRHRLYFAGSIVKNSSSFLWRVDGGDPHVVPGEVPTLLAGDTGQITPLGVVDLAAGAHVLRLRVTGRRSAPDRFYFLLFDALVVQHVR